MGESWQIRKATDILLLVQRIHNDIEPERIPRLGLGTGRLIENEMVWLIDK